MGGGVCSKQSLSVDQDDRMVKKAAPPSGKSERVDDEPAQEVTPSPLPEPEPDAEV